MLRAGLLALFANPLQISGRNFASAVGCCGLLGQALLFQSLTTAQLRFVVRSGQGLRSPEASGSLRLTNISKVHTPIESNTSFGRLVPWIDRFRLSAHITEQVDHRGESSRRYARIATRLPIADPRCRKRLPEFPDLCHAEVQTRTVRVGIVVKDPPQGISRMPIFRRMPNGPLADVSPLEARIRGN